MRKFLLDYFVWPTLKLLAWTIPLWAIGFVLMLCWMASCRPYIPGTSVREPPAEHMGYQLYSCDPPFTTTPVPPDPQNACCWYLAEVDVAFVCTKDGGWNWEQLTPDKRDPTYPDFLR